MYNLRIRLTNGDTIETIGTTEARIVELQNRLDAGESIRISGPVAGGFIILNPYNIVSIRATPEETEDAD